jgi:hypothetical protein
MVHEPNKARWKGTKVDPVSGTIRPKPRPLASDERVPLDAPPA